MTMSRHIATYAMGTGAEWPFVSLPHFETEAQHAMGSVEGGLVAIQPLVSESDRIQWEHYSITQYEWIQEVVISGDDSIDSVPSRITPFIFDSLDTRRPSTSNGHSYAPIWQVAPIFDHLHLINYNTFNSTFFAQIFAKLKESKDAVLSGISKFEDNEAEGPESWIAVPVYRNTSDDTDLVAVLSFVKLWHQEIQDSLPNEDINGIVLVVEFSCDQLHTYKVVGRNIVYLGFGDRHDSRYDQLFVLRDLGGVITTDNCDYSVSIYPSTEYHASGYSTRPLIYAAFVSGLCVTVAIVYCAYIFIASRGLQNTSSRDGSVKSDDTEDLKLNDMQTPSASFDCINPTDVAGRIGAEAETESSAFSLSESLRNNSQAFSATIVDSTSTRISGGETPTAFADEFKDASVMFADVAGFADWSASREPSSVFTLLASVYNAFDKIADRRNIFKVETLGDCYVGAAGLPDPVKNHATVIARFADECLTVMKEVVGNLTAVLGPGTEKLALRVGIHSGPVVAGVLQGEGKFRFQLLGDAVQVAALMLSTSFQNKIHTSPETARLMIEDDKSSWLKPRYSTVYIKEKESQTYWIEVENTTNNADTKRQRRFSNYEIAKLEAKEADSSANMSGGGVVAIANASPHPRRSSITHRRSSLGSRPSSIHSSTSVSRPSSSSNILAEEGHGFERTEEGSLKNGSQSSRPNIAGQFAPEGGTNDGIETVVEETAQQLQNMESPKMARGKAVGAVESKISQQKESDGRSNGISLLMEPKANGAIEESPNKHGRKFPAILLDPGNHDDWSDSLSSGSDSSDQSDFSSEEDYSNDSSPAEDEIVQMNSQVCGDISDHPGSTSPVDARESGQASHQPISESLAKQSGGKRGPRQPSDNHMLIDQTVEIFRNCLRMNIARRGGTVPTGASLAWEEDDTTTKLRISPVDDPEDVLAFPVQRTDESIDVSAVELDPVILEQIKDYVGVIASTFESNPYHSFERAVFVMQSTGELFSNIVSTNWAVEETSDDNGLSYRMKTDRGKLLEFTEGISSDPLVLIAATMSALVQDACHPGIPSSRSVAGKTSLELAWDLLMEPIYNDFRACIYTSMSDKERFRQLLVNAVVAADTSDKELGERSKMRWGQAFRRRDSKGTNAPTAREEIDLKTTLLLEHLVQAANVSHAMNDWQIYAKWNERKLIELQLAHENGLQDEDPSIDFHISELNFLDRVVLPLIRRLRECDALGPVSVEYLKAARQIRQEWSRKGPEFVRNTVLKHQSK